MKKALIFIFFFLFTLSSYSQILPSHQASHYKSSSGAIQGVSATFTSCDAIRHIGPTQAQVVAEYLGNGGANQVNTLDTNDDNVEADGKVIISW